MTSHVLSLSYGKDSLACLEACKLLGYPIDRIIHAEVWATQDIPADLPPMVEFKRKVDRIIKERYGLTVEHVSAVERERDGLITNRCSTLYSKMEKIAGESTVFLSSVEHGATQDSKCKLLMPQTLTYEKIFYRKTKKNVLTGFATK